MLGAGLTGVRVPALRRGGGRIHSFAGRVSCRGRVPHCPLSRFLARARTSACKGAATPLPACSFLGFTPSRRRHDWRPCAGSVHSLAGGAACGGRNPHCQRLNISECRWSAPPPCRMLNAVAARRLRLPAKQHKMTPIIGGDQLERKSAADCLR